jgi:hypothetical protein
MMQRYLYADDRSVRAQESVMRNALYSLEDYFEALAKQRLGRMTRPAFMLASFVCAVMGDVLGTPH